MHPVTKEIVKSVIADLTDRRGISGAWDQIDEDVREEIISTLENKVNDLIEFYIFSTNGT